jgi:hypothetical protein
MDTIVKLVMEKTGLGEAQARSAVETVLGYLKQQLPAPIAGQIDGLVGGASGGATDQAGELLGGLGGMFGKKD